VRLIAAGAIAEWPAGGRAIGIGLTVEVIRLGKFVNRGVVKMANVLGKRYMCEKCGTEVLCNKAGTGAFECCEGEMKLKEAKALPSSD
jgi:hypothetical protein